MQTFLPLPSFERSAAVLDIKRLGKQRVENLQIMKALVTEAGWMHHPATKMWIGSRWALLEYQKAICAQWTSYGYADTCLAKTEALYSRLRREWDQDYPPWFGNQAFHLSHQSNLIRKDPLHYRTFFPDVPEDLPYIWPTSLFQENTMDKIPNLRIGNAEILYRNFTGKEQTFNAKGDRNFCVYLDGEPGLADKLKAEGWNVKETNVRDEGDVARPYMQVKLSYGKGQPPRVVLISSTGRVDLGSEELHLLDYADFKVIDLVINPYEWTVSGNKGVKGYLRTGFFTLDEDEFDLKYAQIPDGNPTTITGIHPDSIVNDEEFANG